MSRPEQVRRRSQQQSVNASRALLLAAGLLAAAAIGLGLWHEASNPRFAVQIVAIEGLGHTTSDDVVNAAALSPGQNAWLINRSAIAHRIETLPWVDQQHLGIMGWSFGGIISMMAASRSDRANEGNKNAVAVS